VPEGVPASESAGSADDLTRLAGIGSKIAHRLNTAGIRTYADLSSRPASEIAKILPDIGLSSARLDMWRGQAQELAAAAAARPEATVAAASDGQHYASFVVRLLLNDDGSIRSTTVERIGTDDVHRWPGWEREALLDFIRTAATSSMPSQVPPPDAETTPTQVTPGEGTPRPAEQLQPVPTSGVPLTISPGAHIPDAAQRMRAVSSAGLSAERTVLRAAERFTMTMSLDFSGAAVDADRLAYSAVIVAKPLTGGLKRTVAHADGLLAGVTSAIRIEAEGLPPGVYRLSGTVSLREPGTGHTTGLAAMAEGLMVQVLAG
jgi:Helix-hairpin-helix domain